MGNLEQPRIAIPLLTTRKLILNELLFILAYLEHKLSHHYPEYFSSFLTFFYYFY